MTIKIKSHDDEVTDFYDKEILKADSNYTCLAVISLDSDLNKDGNYYLQVFLNECKYIKKKVIGHIIDDLESPFDDSHDSEEESIKTMELIFLEKTILKIKFSKKYFLREQFWKSIYRGTNFENIISEGAIFKNFC